MDPDTRRIVAVGAHLLATATCPSTIHSLGTGASFVIEPTPGGFIDLASGRSARIEPGLIVMPDGLPIDIAFDDETTFSGYEPASGERFTGRAGGGATVTIHDASGERFYQYGV
jgi:hypothetical protein